MPARDQVESETDPNWFWFWYTVTERGTAPAVQVNPTMSALYFAELTADLGDLGARHGEITLLSNRRHIEAVREAFE